jgi:hypothetical protein
MKRKIITSTLLFIGIVFVGLVLKLFVQDSTLFINPDADPCEEELC